MVLKHKRWTYMGDPHHSFLWTQWTSEKMYLGTGKEEGWWSGWMNGGTEGWRERRRKQSKPNEVQMEQTHNMAKKNNNQKTKMVQRDSNVCSYRQFEAPPPPEKKAERLSDSFSRVTLSEPRGSCRLIVCDEAELMMMGCIIKVIVYNR